MSEGSEVETEKKYGLDLVKMMEKDETGNKKSLPGREGDGVGSLISQTKKVSSSLTNVYKEGTDKKGGIAFNVLPIQTESVALSVLGSFPGANAFKGDQAAEWSQIQAVFNAGIRPSVQRISEYTAASASSALANERVDQVRVMLADILRRDEESEKLKPAEEALKQLLTQLESNNPAQELQLAYRR